jgi:hypothetical protein
LPSAAHRLSLQRWVPSSALAALARAYSLSA